MGGVREQKKSPDAPGMSDLCGHLFGGARRAVVLVRVGFGLRGGGAGGFGNAGNEAEGQARGFSGDEAVQGDETAVKSSAQAVPCAT